MIDELGISKITHDFLQHNPDPNERTRIANYVKTTFRTCVTVIIDNMAERECAKGNGGGDLNRAKEMMMKQNGHDAVLLAFRILDELMIKEYKSHLNMPGDASRDFATRMFTKEMFLKGVFVCAMESVLFVNVVKSTYSYDLMKQV